MLDRDKILRGWERCSRCLYPSMFDQEFKDCEYTMGLYCRKDKLIAETLELLKDRTKDYEAWAKAIGVDTCVNCRHASFNRNDGKSTCPIEHNFALVKDGYCHLFIRMESEGKTDDP